MRTEGRGPGAIFLLNLSCFLFWTKYYNSHSQINTVQTLTRFVALSGVGLVHLLLLPGAPVGPTARLQPGPGPQRLPGLANLIWNMRNVEMLPPLCGQIKTHPWYLCAHCDPDVCKGLAGTRTEVSPPGWTGTSQERWLLTAWSSGRWRRLEWGWFC